MIFRRISNQPNTVVGFILILLVGLVYYPVLSADFVRWDDTHYILNNLLIRDFEWKSFKDIFTTKQIMGTYSPVVLLTWLIDYQVDGYNPKVFHLVNLAWHSCNSILVFLVVSNWLHDRRYGFIAAVLFAIHPMNVEAVAWATGRKDLVFAGLFLMSLWTYHRFELNGRSAFMYAATFGLFVLSVLSKAVAVVFPVLLLLLDVLIYKRPIGFQLLKNKIPFFIVALIGGIWAVVAQADVGAIESANDIPAYIIPFLFSYRLLLYGLKFIYPFQLSNFHPFDTIMNAGIPWYVFGSLIVVLATTILVWKIGRKKPEVLFGCLMFLLILLPVLQLVPLGNSLIAERYVYLPYIGLFIVLTYGFIALTDKVVQRTTAMLLNTMLIVWMLFLGVKANSQAKVWKNDLSLWSNLLKFYPEDDMGHGKLGMYYAEHDSLEKAMECFNNEIKYAPNVYSGYTNRGLLYEELGDFEKAFEDLNKAIELRDDFAMSRINRGLAFLNTNRPNEAIIDFIKAIEIEENNPIAHFNFGLALERINKVDEAISHYTRAIEIDPKNPEFYYHRGRLYALTFKLTEGLEDIANAIERNENEAKYYVLLSEIYISMGNKFLAKENALQAKARGAVISEEYMELLERK